MRYIPNNLEVRNEMLKEIGVDSVKQLFSLIPDNLLLKKELDISPPVSEFKLMRDLNSLSDQQAIDPISFLGAGVYRRFIPAVISALVSRAEFLTSYTPYQPEVSQGTLQAMFEFQTLLSQLTGMDIANASMYEGASAAAEAVLMCKRIKPKLDTVLISAGLHPEYLEAVKTYTKFKDLKIKIIPLSDSGYTDLAELERELDSQTLCCLIQSVNFFGVIENLKEISEVLTRNEVLWAAVLPEMTSLGMLTPPGDFGADILVGEGQSLGLPLSYGGPNLGVFAAKKKYMRQMPGRLSGETKDESGKRAFCLTLATREQHIRREKATSNICSNQALCALWGTIYLSLLGKKGIKDLSRINYSKTQYAIKELSALEGVKLRYSGTVYNEFVLETSENSDVVITRLREKNILAGVPLSRFYPQDSSGILVNVTEVNTKEEIDTLVTCMAEVLS